MEMHDAPFDLSDISFAEGTIAASGKAKFDEMKNWPEILFCGYQWDKEGNHFVLVKNTKK